MGAFYTFGVALFAALGSFLFGYDSGVVADIVISKHFQKYMKVPSDDPKMAAMVSLFAAGACIGALSGGFTMDTLGRRKTMMIGGYICVIGGILQACAVHIAMVIIGRLVTGWCIGILSMSVPVYQSECAHPKRRGLMIGLSQQMIGIGFIVSTWIGYGASHYPNADNSAFTWRFPFAFQCVPAGILAIGLIWMPESPRQLIEKDNLEEAKRVLNALHYDGTNQDWIDSEFNEIRLTIEAERAITVPGWKPIFTVPQWRTRWLHGFAVQVFTQLTGINVIGYYQGLMYEALGIEGKKATLVIGIYNVVGPIANAFFIFFVIDKVGRKKPLLFGTVGIMLLLVIEASLNSQNLDGTRRPYSIGAIAMLFMVSIVFSWSFGPCSWTYMSEVMPMQIRGKGNALATALGNWLMNVIFSQASPSGLKKLGWKYYFVFVVFDIVVTFPVIYFFFKETKGLSLEEIDTLFGGRALGNLPDDLTDKQIEPEHVEQEGTAKGGTVVTNA